MTVLPDPGLTARRRSALSLLRDPTVGWYFFGKLLSTCGVWVGNIAAAVLVYELTGSAFMVGAVSMMQFLAPLVLAVWTGSLSDRVDRRKQLAAGRLISGSAVALLAVLVGVYGKSGFGGTGVLLALLFVMGIGLALSMPAMQALVPSLVPEHELEPAIALVSVAPSIARAAGPALGAGLLVVGGPALAFAFAGCGHFVFVIVLACIRPRARAPVKERPRLLGGIQYLLKERTIGLLMLGVAGLGFGADSVVTLTPPMADRLAGGAGLVGVLASAFGVGAVPALFVLGRLRQRLTLRLAGMSGYCILAAGLAVCGFASNWAVAVAGMLLTGLGFMVGTIALNTRIQQRVPDELRGRVMAFWGVAYTGSRPLAALVNGSMADWVSISAAFFVAAAMTLIAIPLAGVRDRSLLTEGLSPELRQLPEP